MKYTIKDLMINICEGGYVEEETMYRLDKYINGYTDTNFIPIRNNLVVLKKKLLAMASANSRYYLSLDGLILHKYHKSYINNYTYIITPIKD